MTTKTRDGERGFVRTDDGNQLFCRVHGDGDPPIVCCNGIGVSTFFWHFMVERFRDRCPVLLWDYRGHGRSQIPAPDADLSIPRMARDMWTVVDAQGLDKPILAGHSMGVQVILEAFRQRPDDVGGLVLVLGTYARPLDTFYDFKYSRQAFATMIGLFSSRSGPAIDRWLVRPLLARPIAWNVAGKAGMVDTSRLDRGELRRYRHHLMDVSMPFFMKMAKQMGEHDASDVLERIDVPTLIVAAEYDTFTPIAASYHMRDTIEGAELLYLEGATHAGIVEQPEVIYPRIDRWMADHFEGRLGVSTEGRAS